MINYFYTWHIIFRSLLNLIFLFSLFKIIFNKKVQKFSFISQSIHNKYINHMYIYIYINNLFGNYFFKKKKNKLKLSHTLVTNEHTCDAARRQSPILFLFFIFSHTKQSTSPWVFYPETPKLTFRSSPPPAPPPPL